MENWHFQIDPFLFYPNCSENIQQHSSLPSISWLHGSIQIYIHNGFNSFHKNRFKISYTFDDRNGIKEKKKENAITFKSAI